MANRNWNQNRSMNRGGNLGGGGGGGGGEFGRGYERPFSARPQMAMSPWQGGQPGANPEALSLASNLIANFLQQRGPPGVPSLLDVPVRRNFDTFDRFSDRRPQLAGRMGSRMNQGGNFNRRFGAPGKRPANPINQQRNKAKPFKKNTEGNAIKPDSKAKEEGAEGETNGDAAEKGEKGEKAEKGDKGGATPYDGIPMEFLHCHVCEKKMWDGRSFQNHIGGRAHNLMMEKNRESYALTADAMRQQMRAAERKRGVRSDGDYYCAMCDLYCGDAAKHRLSLGHRRLKRYLHPSCNCCRKENATRIELDLHRLSPQHMRTMQEKSGDFSGKGKPEVAALQIFTKEQELVHVKYPKRPYGKYKLAPTANPEAASPGDLVIKKERPEGDKEGGEGEAKEGGEGAAPAPAKEEGPPPSTEDPSKYILDYQEGTDLTGRLEEEVPGYDIEIGYGKSFIEDYNCKQCSLCKKILDNEETAEVHLKTWRHYKKFTDLLREKAGLRVKPEKRNLTDAEGGEDSKRQKFDEEGNPIEAMDTTEGEVKLEADANGEASEGEGEGGEADAAAEEALLEEPAAPEPVPAPEAPEAPQAPAAPQPLPEPAEAPEAPEPPATPGKKTPGRPRGRGARGRRY